jgi:hypothetical protein
MIVKPATAMPVDGICFWCGAEHSICQAEGMTPCPICQMHMKLGHVIIDARNTKGPPDEIWVQFNPDWPIWTNGRWMILTEADVHVIFERAPKIIKQAKKATFIAIPGELFDLCIKYVEALSAARGSRRPNRE